MVYIPLLAVIIMSSILTLLLTNVGVASKVKTMPKSTSKSESRLANFFSPEVLLWTDQIITWADTWQIDPNLIATVIQIESCGNPRAKSGAGAMGIFQVMPFHFEATENPLSVETNAKRGLSYLKQAITQFGDDNIRYSLAGYNAGIYGAMRGELLWPDETTRYVYWGSGIYADAQKGLSESERLMEWLNNGGKALCSQANVSLSLSVR